MAPIKASYSLVVRRSPRGMAKIFNEVRKDAMEEVGEKWHDEFLPRHFEENAMQRYHYVHRAKKYDQRKERKMGHKKPLVWSGTLRKTILENTTITATKSSVLIKMTGPKWLAGYLSFKGRNKKIRDKHGNDTGRREKAGGPDKKAEITKVLKSEAEELAKLLKSRIVEALNKARD
jgi:hypothetical protein